MTHSEYYCESTGVELDNEVYRAIGKQVEDCIIKTGMKIDQCEMCRFRNGLLIAASIGGKQVARVVDIVERENYKRMFLEVFEHAFKETNAVFAKAMN